MLGAWGSLVLQGRDYDHMHKAETPGAKLVIRVTLSHAPQSTPDTQLIIPIPLFGYATLKLCDPKGTNRRGYGMSRQVL